MQLPPDLEALRWCLRHALGGRSTGDSASPPQADWDRVTRAAGSAGVLSLLHHGLRKAGLADELPEEARRRCLDAHYRTAQTNALTYDALGKLLSALRARDMAALPLKGAHLAELTYRNVALRAVGDLDLLAKSGDLPAILGAVAALGYQVPIKARLEAHLPGLYHEVSRLRGRGRPDVDLHVRLVPLRLPLAVDTADMWQRARRASLGSAETLVMSPEDLLAHVCVHFSCIHLFRAAWRPLCDVTMILRRHAEDLDWDRLAAMLDAWGAGRCVGIPLGLAQELLGAPVPGGATRRLGVRETDMQAAYRLLADTLDPLEDGTEPQRLGASEAAEVFPTDANGRSRGNRASRALAWARASARAYGPSLRSPWVCLYCLRRGAAALLRPRRLRHIARRRDIELWLTAPPGR